MKYKVFVDGSAGTTGLRIFERLNEQKDVELLKIAPELRKDAEERGKRMNEADVVFLCLPDAASREAVKLVTNPHTRVIDSSTAFRTDPSWAYGFPELSVEQREKIRVSKRVAVPGCHATGFISLVYPLVRGGVISKDYPLCCHSLSGYSGGGKKLIQAYEESRDSDRRLQSPRYYGLSLCHKHLPEMQSVCGLAAPPLFTPVVDDYFEGMLVSVPLHRRLLAKDWDAGRLRDYYGEYYGGSKLISVAPLQGGSFVSGGFLDAVSCNGTDSLQIFVFSNGDQIFLVSRLDNLGKGASGAAVQCMNIMLGRDETEGLCMAF